MRPRTSAPIVRILVLFGILAPMIPAAPQVGTVIASEPFELKGARVTTTGVPSWPVSAGDEIATENSPVRFQFPDGSQITLEPNSRARVEGTKRSPVFRLLDCTADYQLKHLSSVMIFGNAQVQRISNLNGKFTVGCRATAAKAAAGAAGAGAASGAAGAGAGAAGAGAASASVGAASAGAASAGAATAGVASATAAASAATAGVASAATIGASAAAAAGVATSVGVVTASTAGAPPPVSP
ncbi:MAG TPA: hypothetical protein VG273_13325 [Bryobacteraceae bacterium]|nr:hypothetical protein [Bryobacteraceae bacterium]